MEAGIIIAFYICILLYSIILHEIAHGVAALGLGDHTAKNEGRLTLNPLPHIDPVGSILLPLSMLYMANIAFGWARPVPYNPHALRFPRLGPVIVALAGPLTNFSLAVFGVVGGALLSVSSDMKIGIVQALTSRSWERVADLVSGDLSAIFFVVMVMIVFWNVLLGLFNLLPLPPLDGSKIVYAIVPVPEQAKQFLEQWGFLILIGLLFLTPLGVAFSNTFQNILEFLFAFMII